MILGAWEMRKMPHFLSGTTKNHVQPGTAVLQRKSISHDSRNNNKERGFMNYLLRIFVLCFLSLILFSCSPPQSKKKKRTSSKGKYEYSKIRLNKEITGIVDGLIKSKGNLNQRYNTRFKKDNNKTPILVWAIQCHDIDSVKRLLKHGADPNVTVLKGASETALLSLPFGTDLRTPEDVRFFDMRKRNNTICKILVKAKADVKYADKLGKTALMKSAIRGREDLCSVLIAAGAPLNAKDIIKQTALHMAAEKGYWKVIQVLVEKNADANLKDKLKRTALLCAEKRSEEKLYKKTRKVLPYSYSNADYDKTIKILRQVTNR